MNIVFILGPPAVGKMTVGQELSKLTGYKLFHNHMSIELVYHFFDFGTPEFRKLDDRIRFAVFEELAQSDLAGLIFTLVWDFNDPEDEKYVDAISEIFEERGGRAFFVELSADINVRKERNRTENRLLNKPTKRDLARSERNLIQSSKDHRCNSEEGEFAEKEILRIDNTFLHPEEAALKIAKQFLLRP
ncbi:MAG: AAA family ATPase [Bacteroidia bacterium]|nr:AAA family ATPase [Bacteroidia bacterium]